MASTARRRAMVFTKFLIFSMTVDWNDVHYVTDKLAALSRPLVSESIAISVGFFKSTLEVMTIFGVSNSHGMIP